MSRVTVWQCTDWCCDTKPHSDKWWNVAIAPGNYDSVSSWPDALDLAAARIRRTAS